MAKKKNALLLATLMSLPGMAVAAPVLDQQQPVIDNNAGVVLAISAGQKLAQTVTAGIAGYLTEVRFPVACTNPGPDLVIEIQGVTAGVPNGTVLTSQNIPASSLPPFSSSQPVFRSLALLSPVFFEAGNQFAIVLVSEGSCGMSVGPAGDSYTKGNMYFDSLPNPSGWVCNCIFSGERYDLPFQTLSDALAPPPPPVPTMPSMFLVLLAVVILAIGWTRLIVPQGVVANRNAC
jgi:hypothetical protein